MKNDRGKQELAAEAWRRIFGFFMSTRPRRDLVLKQLGLTPNDAKALSSLDRKNGRTMSSLAQEWICDPSNATWMVDRLEQRGLAARRVVPTDKRVKLVVLTAVGATTKSALLSGMIEPPSELLDLDQAALEDLLQAVAKLPLSTGTAQSFQPADDVDAKRC